MISVETNVSDPHGFYADPDPALKMNADSCESGSWIYVKNKNLVKVKK
jgi:hypothetical protein